MNVGLRSRHRLWTRVLFFAAALGLVLALVGRAPPPEAGDLPAPIAEIVAPEGEPIWDRTDLLDEFPVRARRFPGLLELTPERDPRRPDVLAYWAVAAAAPDRLPEDAYLLGRLSGRDTRALPLPRAARNRAGHLFLYSLGHQEVLDSGALPEPAR